MSRSSSLLLLLLIFLSSYLLTPSTAQQQQQNFSSFSFSDSPWRPNQNQILISPNSTFAAGFRPSPISLSLYIFSVWYLNVSDETIVWSVNPNSPVNRSSSLVITSSGALVLNDSAGKNLWPTSTAGNSNTTVLVLGDDGNLVFGNWVSFDSPTDTILPEQTINGTVLFSKNGKFMFRDSKDLVLVNSSQVYWSGDNTFLKMDSSGKLVMDGSSWISADFGATRLRRLILEDSGNLRIYSLDPASGTWVLVWQAVQELCTIRGVCGPNYICMTDGLNSTYCICPAGFRRVGDLCERNIPLAGTIGSRFLPLDYVNFSGGSNQTDLKAPNYTTCESKCLANPRCLGFGFKFDGSQYCVHQLDRLLYGYWSPGIEATMFLRVSKNESAVSNFTGMTSMLETTCPVRISLPLPPQESKTEARNLAIICTLFAIELISGVLAFWAFLKKYIKYRDMAGRLGLEFLPAGGPKRFTYAELKEATNDFSNVIGHGGFGVVYKGELPDRRSIAVKRLKDISGGEADFWAEVTIIARMHHLNLVRMWGFCAEKSQRLLVYEYIPNGSLDKFLFPAVQPVSSESDTGTGSGSDTAKKIPVKPTLDWNISEEWYFPRWAFEKVYREVKVEDILDGRIKHCYDSELHFDMVDRMVKTAMWCLQDRAETRPSMGKVAKMLEGTVEITEPGKPTIFYLGDD
ncbi:hypothetical protein HHK36_024212 [Tetracentron sinense]|uniref:non-specific serine/threonine protein kinase n=1 Tax=Tetracentron sinense TaxID=13715 RepID=A0A834YNE6_TETSI|nr:hypothetical protein HHK36_024212 [Tetracentron sinense]